MMRYKIVNRKKLLATALVDSVGAIATLPFRLFRKIDPIEPESVRSILLIRDAYLGDVVMTLPILAPLRRRFPGAKITFLTSSSARPVLETNPHVDEILTYDAFWFYPQPMNAYWKFLLQHRRREFDLVIEARGDIRDILMLAAPPRSRWRVGYGIGGGAWMLTDVVPFRKVSHKVEFHLDIARYLGCECGEVEWGFYFRHEEIAAARGILKSHGIEGPFLAAHPGSRMPLKRWPYEKCAALYDRLMQATGQPLVIFGAPGEKSLIREVLGKMRGKPVDLSGHLGVRQLGALFSMARMLVCNDSAPMHIAACAGTPTVALFGPSVSAETSPWGKRHRVIEKDFLCRAGCDESTCKHPDPQACMKAIEVDEVLGAAMEIFRGVSG